MLSGDETTNTNYISGKNNNDGNYIRNMGEPRSDVKISHCLACNRNLEQDMHYCPNCGRPVDLSSSPSPSPFPQQLPRPPIGEYPYPPQRTNKSVVGGILTIIGAAFCLVEANFIMLLFMNNYNFNFRPYIWDWMGYWPHWWWFYIISIIFQFWGFAIGITGGIVSLKKMKFPIAIIGSVFVLVAGCLAIAGTFFIGIIVLIIGILAIIFTSMAKNEYSNY